MLATEGGVVPELTLRAVAIGLVIGIPLALGNVYLGLTTGWSDSGNLTAALVGYALASALTRRGAGRYTILENNVTQAVAAAAAGTPAVAGLLGALPALAMLGHRTSTLPLLAWGLAIACFGLLAGLSLRERLLERDALPFPTGRATAELITTLHTTTRSVAGRARALLGAGALTMALVWFRDGKPALLPSVTAMPGKLAGSPAGAFTLGIAWSPMMLGAGALIGPRLGLSVALGAAIAWVGVGPALVRAHVAEADYGALVAWIAWPGTALMVGAALTALAQQGRALVAPRGRAPAEGRPRLLRAQIAAAVVIVLLGWLVFRASPLAMIAGLVLSHLLAGVCARAAGQTDISPAGTMGQLSQVAFAGLAPGRVVDNLAGATLVSGSAAQAATTLWILRAGRQLGGSIRGQIVAQLCGIVAGLAAVVPAYALLARAGRLGTPSLPAPAAVVFKTIGEVLTEGGAALPAHAAVPCLLAFAAGIVLAWQFDRSRFVPSAVAVGVGFLVPAHYAVTICLGSLLSAAVVKRYGERGGELAPAIATGAIAGESVAGVAIALLGASGVI